jgi:hypothetical protein
VTTDQSIVHPQDGTLVMEKQWNDIEREAEILGEKAVLLPLCPQQI